jgi:lipid II:glycine glycyltransferase (peptidoglycan interpeptide bridge formation enzyme)
LANVTPKKWHIRQVSRSEWSDYWLTCPKQNLLQSWEYGAAKEASGGWTPKRLVIFNQDDLPIALVQVLTKCIPLLGGIARINRGPLLFDGDAINDLELKLEALKILMAEARCRQWWVIQIAPELCDSYDARVGLQKLGLRKQKKTAWASSLMDLSLSIDDLYRNLNRRWKRALSKASKLGVIVKSAELTEKRLANVLRSYSDLQKLNKFVGIDTRLIKEMSKSKSADWDFNLFVAELVTESSLKEEVGYRVTIRNGHTVLDFLVSTNEKGRHVGANSALYWHAILQAKESGCRWFDVGGFNELTPQGISDFKRGLNGTPYKLIGEWRRWFWS